MQIPRRYPDDRCRARLLRHKKYGATRWQLIGERNWQRFLHELGIDRASQRVVIILFFLGARRFQAKLVKLVPGLLRRRNGRPPQELDGRRSGAERLLDLQDIFETLATARDDLLIIQISQSVD